MRSKCFFGFTVAVLMIGSILSVQTVSAQSFGFPVGGFTSTNVCANTSTPPPSCQVLTNGSPKLPQVVSGGILRLTSANLNQHGSAWFALPQPLSTGFTTAFQFKISKTNSCFLCTFPADGMALVIQNDPAGTGALGYIGNGENISYGNNDVSTASGPKKAIKNSLAIELDTHQNSDYSDPDGNHIAVQSCGPNTPSTLTPNTADHNYMCPDGNLAKLALQSLPSGVSLTDGNIHTITVNYLPPGTCTSACNNLSVYFDSTLILQATVDITKQLNLTGGTSAYIGFTAATGALVQNNDIISWSFSQWPLAPITINQPVQPTVTNFSYTSNLSATTDYSQSGLQSSSFQGLFMQGTATAITDQQFADLVNNTPFQGSTCQHQDTGNGNFSCVTTTDLCTTPTNSVAAGANCLTTGTNPLINVTNTYTIDPAQKPIVAPGYIMGKDTALSCGHDADNTCKGLVSIFASISGDPVMSGHTNNFNSVLIPILGGVQPTTSVTTTPPLNGGWINTNFSVNFNSIDTVPSNNSNPPSTLPTVTSINYTATGPNVPSQASGTLTGSTGSINIPVTAEGTTVITYSATDSSNVIETLITNNGTTVSSSTPTFTIKVDLTPPTLSCTQPAAVWQATDVVVSCTASDNASGSGLVGPPSFTVQTNVPAGTETNSVTIPAVTVKDVAGNISAPQPAQGAFGPFEVDKKAPVITGPTISPASPIFGQAVTASYECTDGGSGVVSCGPTGSSPITATGDTGPLNNPADSTVGTHTFTVNAQDQVGNVSTPTQATYTVGKATPVITWTNPAAITYGTALSTTQLNATASVSGTFVYTPAAGAVLTAGTQTLSVTFTPDDTTDYTPATNTFSLLVNQATPTITWAPPAAITYGTALGAAQLSATASVPGTFVYTPAAGTVLTAGPQTLSVAFTPTDAVNYTTASATVPLTVVKATPMITWAPPAAITFGTALSGTQLNATASVPGTLVYTPAAGTVLGAGPQTLSVAFTPTDTTNYANGSATVPLTVVKGTPTITWAAPAAITYGTPLSGAQLNASANVPGTFVYTPAAGTVLTAGTQTLLVSFTPSDATDYSSASAAVPLLVNKAMPIITWPTPAPIAYGTALSAAQLNATASVPGTFTYAPPAGTVLPAGTQTLSVTFAPADSIDYTAASASVMLVVTQPQISLSPSSINFGTIVLGKTVSQTETITNVGNGALSISKVSVKPGSGTDNDDFKLSTNCGSLAPGASCNIVVSYTPDDGTGGITATLVITDNAPGSPHLVGISANVVKHK